MSTPLYKTVKYVLTSFLCRGITRITVTVVVIMFELTGALTYILPTMVSPVVLSQPIAIRLTRAYRLLSSSPKPSATSSAAAV